MQTFEDYSEILLSSIGDNRVKKNFISLSKAIFSKHSIQLWKLSTDKKTYNRYRDMLNGNLLNGIDSNELNISLLQSKLSRISDKDYVVFVHDGCDIRKAYSKDLAHLGWVRSLEGKWIRGYSTLNTVCVAMQSPQVDLLYCSPYSSELPEYVSQKERKAYETGQLKDPVRHTEIEELLAKGLDISYKKVLFAQIKAVSEAVKSKPPEMMVIHVLDRYQDDKEVFEYIESLGDYFVIRLKKNHKDTEGIAISFCDLNGEVRQNYQRLSHLEKEYKNMEALYQWGEYQDYSMLRVSLFHQKTGKRVFKEPMLIISNLVIEEFLTAFWVFELYLHRWKIESVFRFLKQVLGWEEFLIQDWESIKNLITLAFFVGGYFYEIEDQLTKDEQIIWLAELGGGKGKVTRGYILKGIAKILEVKQTQDFLKNNNISEQQVKQTMERFLGNKYFS